MPILVVKMAAVLEECTTEEQRSVVRFFSWTRGYNEQDIHKYFMFTAGGVYRVKRLTTGREILSRTFESC
jgi:hypothetical protein